MADPNTEKLLARITADARVAFGADLVGVVVYGSAAGDDFVAGVPAATDDANGPGCG